MANEVKIEYLGTLDEARTKARSVADDVGMASRGIDMTFCS